MKKNLHEIDKLFLSQLEHYEERPPENTWLEIENSLNKNEADKYRKRYQATVKVTACIILLCLSLLLNDVMKNPAGNSNKKWVLTMISREKEKLPAKKNLSENLIGDKNNGIKNKSSFKAEPYFNKWNRQYFSSASGLNNIPRVSDTGGEYEIVPIKKKPIVNFFDATSQEKTSVAILDNKKNDFNVLSESSGDYAKTGVDTRITKNHKISLAPFFSFDYLCSRMQEVYKYGNLDQQDIAGREKPDMSYTSGLMAEYRISKKWVVQSGISLSNSFTSVSPTIINAVKDNSGIYKFKLATTYGLAEITKTGITNPQDGDSLLLTDASLHVQYITLPLLAKYVIKPGRFTVSAIAGLGINKIVSERMEVDYKASNNSDDESESIQKIEGLKKSFITGIAGAEATYAINQKISVGFNPLLRYSFTPINEGTPIKLYPVNIGLAALVKIKL